MDTKQYEAQKKARQQRVHLSLLCLFLAGLFLLQVDLPFNEHIGIAFIIAAILGITVDIYLKQNLANDAVSAALGYLLPDELKDELRWIYDQKFLATQTFNVRLEHIPEKKIVVMHGSVVRKIKNISNEKANVVFSGGAEEWFHPHATSEITKCGYTVADETTLVTPIRTESGITYKGPDGGIPVERDKTLEWFFSYSTVLSENGMEALVHRYPIVDAQVIVEAPTSLLVHVNYSNRGKYEKEQPLETGFISRPLKGILLPHQDIRIYWYFASAIERRRREIANTL